MERIAGAPLTFWSTCISLLGAFALAYLPSGLQGRDWIHMILSFLLLISSFLISMFIVARQESIISYFISWSGFVFLLSVSIISGSNSLNIFHLFGLALISMLPVGACIAQTHFMSRIGRRKDDR